MNYPFSWLFVHSIVKVIKNSRTKVPNKIVLEEILHAMKEPRNYGGGNLQDDLADRSIPRRTLVQMSEKLPLAGRAKIA